MKKLNRDYILKDVKDIYSKHLKTFEEIKEAVDDNRKRYTELVNDNRSYTFQKKQELLKVLDDEYNKLKLEVNNNVVNYLSDIEELKKDSEYRFRSYYAIDSDSIDENTYNLLDKGLLTDNEIIALYPRFKNNRTMLRAIAKFTENNKSNQEIISLHKRCEIESRGVNEVNESIDKTTPWITRALGYCSEDTSYSIGIDRIQTASAFQRRIDEQLSEIASGLNPVIASNDVGSIKMTYSQGE